MISKPTLTQCLKAGLFAGIGAVLINALLFLVFKKTGIISDAILIPPANEPMTMVPVVMASLIPAVLGSGVYYLFARFTAQGYRNFFILAIALLILSFTNSFMAIPNVPLSYAVALNIMHVVVAGCLLYSLRKFTVAALQQA